jgi:pulcherriminic acid synthase
MRIPAAPHPDVLMLTSRRTAVAGLCYGRINVEREYGTTWNNERDPRDLLRRSGPELTRIHQVIEPVTGPIRPERREAARLRARQLATAIDLSDGPVDIITSYVEPFIAGEVVRDMGVPYEDWESKINGPTDIVLGLRETDDAQHAIQERWHDIYDYCHGLTADKLQHPDGSIVSQAAAALRRAGFEFGDIAHVVATFLTGYPTPVSVLSTVIAELLSQPEARAACLAHPEYYELALREAMRKSANFAYGSPREITSEISFGDVVIPAGSVVIPHVARALNDPTVISHPERFDMMRPQAGKWSLAYGTGPHRCPFVRSSFATMLVGLTEFCQAHPGAELVPPGDLNRGLLPMPKSYEVRLGSR